MKKIFFLLPFLLFVAVAQADVTVVGQGAGTGDVVSTNNLSDVADAPTAFNNIKQSATTSASGVVELATDAEAVTGTDTGRGVTPANVTAKLGDWDGTPTGTGNIVRDTSPTLAAPVLTTPNLRGKIGLTGTAVDDDDCTGEQGSVWWDSVDGKFEICNANSGAPDTITGGDLKADGTVPLTANWDVGAYTITGTQFISDIATGTSPFAVTSTTKVANLNCDLLDDTSIASFYISGGTDVPVIDGGTGASTSSGARTNLGVAIGTNVQAYSATLASLADLTETNGGIPYGTADNTYAWLPAGASGYLLQGNGAGAPSWTSSIAISAIDLASGTFVIPNGTSDATLATAGQVHLNTTDEQLSFHSAADGEISGEVALSLINHISLTFDPAAVYDQESTFRSLPLMWIGDDAPEGITITEWRVQYVGGDPTTELDADIICDTTPDFNVAAGATVMDVLDTTTGASTADTGFDSASCANGSRLYIHFGADPTDANVLIAFDLWYYTEED